MLLSILVTFVILAALGLSVRGERGELIARHAYNNRHSDAAGAREDSVG